MVNKHIDVLVEELSTDDDPQTICANAGICKWVTITRSDLNISVFDLRTIYWE